MLVDVRWCSLMFVDVRWCSLDFLNPQIHQFRMGGSQKLRPQHLGGGGFDDHAAPAPVMKSLTFWAISRWRRQRNPFSSHQDGTPWFFQFFFFAANLLTGWWFGTFFIFPNSWDDDPIWLIFFRGVETTNQLILPFWEEDSKIRLSRADVWWHILGYSKADCQSSSQAFVQSTASPNVLGAFDHTSLCFCRIVLSFINLHH